MLTMVLGGLWHGASWTFVVWGALHGCYLVVERILRKGLGQRAIFHTAIAQVAITMGTFLAVLITWVFFRATTFQGAFGVLRAMFYADGHPLSVLRPAEATLIAAVALGLVMVHWALRDSSIEAVFQGMPWWLRSVCLAILSLTLLMVPGEDRAFIYFQF